MSQLGSDRLLWGLNFCSGILRHHSWVRSSQPWDGVQLTRHPLHTDCFPYVLDDHPSPRGFQCLSLGCDQPVLLFTFAWICSTYHCYGSLCVSVRSLDTFFPLSFNSSQLPGSWEFTWLCGSLYPFSYGKWEYTDFC